MPKQGSAGAPQENDFRNVNVEEIQRILFSEFDKIKTAKDANNVLVIGNTGAGKSTLVNYLLGEEMELLEVEDEDGGFTEMVVVKNNQDDAFLQPVVGHDGAQTLHAQTFSREDQPFSFTDCPGFLGGRKIEERVVESVGTEIAIRMSAQINSIIVVIPYKDLVNDTRAIALSSLCKTLINMLRDYSKAGKQLLWVVSRKPLHDTRRQARLRGELLGNLNKRVKSFREKAEKVGADREAGTGLSGGDYLLLADVFGEVAAKFDDVVVMSDVLDDGTSRKDILTKLQQPQLQLELSSASVDNFFMFNQYDPYRKSYREALVHMAHDGIDLMHGIEHLTHQLSNFRDRIERDENAIQGYERQRESVTHETDGMQLKTERKVQYERDIEENKRIIERKEKTRSDHQENIKRQNALREKFATDDPVQHWFASDRNFEIKSSWFSRIEHKFVYPYSEPVHSVTKEAGDKGTFSEPVTGTNIWESTFTSNLTGKKFGSGKVSVTVYIKKRHTADAKAIIQTCDDQIGLEENAMSELNNDIQRLTAENQRLGGLIVQLNSDQLSLKQLRQKAIDNINASIAAARERIVENTRNIESGQNRLNKLKASFADNQAKYQTILLIVKYIKFESRVIDNFAESYDTFVRSYIDSAQVGSASSDPVDDANASFKCPLSGKVMHEPVSTPCCNLTYDRSSLVPFIVEGTGQMRCPEKTCEKLFNTIELRENLGVRRLVRPSHSGAGIFSAVRADREALEAELQQVQQRRDELQLELERLGVREHQIRAELSKLPEDLGDDTAADNGESAAGSASASLV